ncbi:MAG: nitroreductase family protein [Syntrophomonadaceae bacterium]|nr:nitroreductase family protein [Syntrophomonadaceae bacterium]
MEIQAIDWYKAIFRRKSRRQFIDKGIPAEVFQRLENACSGFRPFAGVRAALVHRNAEEVFTGVIGSYGKIKGASAYIAFIGDMGDPFVQEKVGYFGEALILEATVLGLATCWVGGFFRAKTAARHVSCQNNEQVLAVTPVGYVDADKTNEEKIMSGFVSSYNRKPLDRLIINPLAPRPEWAKAGLEAARLAPSAVNRQPWRFQLEEASVLFLTDRAPNITNISKRLDCGIAMLHFELGALSLGAKGKWEFLPPPEVARFFVDSMKRT